jgi:hypothetical protein
MEIKNCFISIQSNIRLLEYICCIVQTVYETSQQRPPKEQRSVRPSRSSYVFNIPKPIFFEGSFYRWKMKQNPLLRDQENGAWLISTTPCLAKNVFITSAEWEGHCHATRTNCRLLEIVASLGKCASTIFR